MVTEQHRCSRAFVSLVSTVLVLINSCDVAREQHWWLLLNLVSVVRPLIVEATL